MFRDQGLGSGAIEAIQALAVLGGFKAGGLQCLVVWQCFGHSPRAGKTGSRLATETSGLHELALKED